MEKYDISRNYQILFYSFLKILGNLTGINLVT